MDFKALLSSGKPVLLDGAMGTELFKKGVNNAGEGNLTLPDAVKEVHAAYLTAGSGAVITNTLTMNRVYIKSHHLDLNVRAVNEAAARIAREAGKGHFVLGNLSSTGQLLEPYGSNSEADFVSAFREQASILSASGVDALFIETIFDLREALCALKGCKEASGLPVMVSMAFDTDSDGGKTVMGNGAAECAEQLTAAGADAVGANCGRLDPLQMANLITAMRKATSLPLIAEPNAGKPRLVNGATLFEMAPGPFATGVMECVKAGALLVGGCCGTTPDHIRAVRALMDAA
jgi:5-methyltetrahydrofolate--homocysteine methyltransferase